MPEQYEPIRNDESWMIQFTLPETLQEKIVPAKINNVKPRDGMWVSDDKFVPKIDLGHLNKQLKNELGEIEITFNDTTDKLDEAKSIRHFMDEWIKLTYKEFEQQAVNFFALFEYDAEHSTNENSAFMLKKPIADLTEEEKDFLRETLTGVGVTDLSKWGL